MNSDTTPAPSASAHAALPPEGGLSTRPGGAGAEPPSLAAWLSATRAWFDVALDALVPPATTRPAAKLADVVRAHVRRVLALHDGNIAAAARTLGVSRSTVRAHST